MAAYRHPKETEGREVGEWTKARPDRHGVGVAAAAAQGKVMRRDGGTAGTGALTGAENHLHLHEQFSRDPSHPCTILPIVLSCLHPVLLVLGSVHPPFALLFTLVVLV